MCRAEAPHLSELQKKYRSRGLVVLGINIDNDTAKRVDKFVQDKGLDYTMLLNGDGVAFGSYSCRAFPTLYWIDKTGKIRGRDYGFQSTSRLEARVQGLLE